MRVVTAGIREDVTTMGVVTAEIREVERHDARRYCWDQGEERQLCPSLLLGSGRRATTLPVVTAVSGMVGTGQGSVLSRVPTWYTYQGIYHPIPTLVSLPAVHAR